MVLPYVPTKINVVDRFDLVLCDLHRTVLIVQIGCVLCILNEVDVNRR